PTPLPGTDKVGKLVRLRRPSLVMLQGGLNLARVALGMLAHTGATAARRRRRHPAQGIALVITHDATRRAGLDHVTHDQQCLADARTTVDDVPEKQRLSQRMAPHPTYPRIPHLLQQLLERMRAA